MRHISLNNKGFAPLLLLVGVVAVLVVGGGGVYVYHQNHKAKAPVSSSTSTGSKTTSTTSTKSTAASDPYAGWKQYCSAQEKSCFKYPADWTTKNVGAVDPAGDGIQLTSPGGTVIWFQSAVSGLGGACQPGTPDVYIQKVIAEPHVSNLYVVESGTQSTTNHIGLVNGTNGKAPQTGDTSSCISATTFTSEHDPSVYAWLESNGVDNLKAADLSTAELVLESYTY
jgi:hypothetical protein